MSTTTRLSSSSPVSATTTSARATPAWRGRWDRSRRRRSRRRSRAVFVIICALLGVFLDDDDFVLLLDEPAREIRADLAAADDNDEHITVFLRRVGIRAFSGFATGTRPGTSREAARRVRRDDRVDLVAFEQLFVAGRGDADAAERAGSRRCESCRRPRSPDASCRRARCRPLRSATSACRSRTTAAL
jgi:hypothetical protein